MTRALYTPDNPRDPIMDRRVSTLERRSLTRQTNLKSTNPVGGIRLLWEVNGTITTGKSHRFDLETGDSFTLDSFRIRLATTGTTTTTVELRRNGIAVATLTLTSGVATNVASESLSFVGGDYLEYAITGAGTGAADLLATTRLV